MTEYKGYAIDNFYQGNGYFVHYCGDDVFFRSIDEAKAFIDEVTKEERGIKYIINHKEKADGNKVVQFSAYAAEMASTPQEAAERFSGRHPDREVLSVREEEDGDRELLGLSYMTDEQREDYENRIHDMYSRMDSQLEEIRARICEQSPEEFAANVEYEERRASEKTQNAEGVHLGDIFYTSWGYDQTNIDFYQVVALKGKHTIVLRMNKAKSGLSDSWNGLTRPIRDEFEEGYFGELKTVRTKLVDLNSSGQPELWIHVDNHSLRPVVTGRLYEYSTGA